MLHGVDGFEPGPVLEPDDLLFGLSEISKACSLTCISQENKTSQDGQTDRQTDK